jgi:uncharacterized membrane protein
VATRALDRPPEPARPRAAARRSIVVPGVLLGLGLGVFMLCDRSRANGGIGSWAGLAGLLLIGWGIFNLVEGVIDHQILGIHHLRDDEGAPLGWDLGFLAFGALLVVAGWLMARPGPRRNDATGG